MSGYLKTEKLFLGNARSGDKVVIFSEIVPAGVFEGVLVIDEKHSFAKNVCYAVITDSRVDEGWIGREPHMNYKVMFPDEAVTLLLAQKDEQKKEINGLLRRIKQEREVLYGAMRAMVSESATKKLEELIALLLKK